MDKWVKRNASTGSFEMEPLEAILGNKSAYWVMLFIYHYGEVYPTQIANSLDANLTPILDQLNKFSDVGLLNRKKVGNTTLYSFNRRNYMYESLNKLIGAAYEAIPIKERGIIFEKRTRSRKKGKEIING